MGRGLFWGGLAVGLGLGAGLGYAWGSRARPAPPEPAEASVPEVVPASPSGEAAAPAEAPVASPPRAAAPEARPRPRVELTGPQIAELKARVSDLTKQLAQARDLLSPQAPQLSPPPGLPERFSQKAVIAAITSALKEVGSRAQLTSVDCTEYPCIAYFQGLTDTELQSLKQSSAYQTYAHDRFMTIGRAGVDGPYDGLVVWPSNDANPRENVRGRLRFRMGQIFPTE